MENIWLAFITGLTTGGISCLAIQGGLLTSSIPEAKNLENIKNKKVNYVLIFLLAKLFAYTLLGFLLGFVGSYLIVSPKIQAFIQLFIGIFLLGTAGKLLKLHPIFRYFSISPPKFIYRMARVNSKNKTYFAPAFLGILTVLMPCGVTQAMMLVALGVGNPILSSAIMFAFVLGTSPVFFLLGITALELFKKKAFSYVAALVVLVFGIISINSAIGLFGSVHTLQNFWKAITQKDNRNGTDTISIVNKSGVQEATIYVQNQGYNSDVSSLKVGMPVKLTLVTKDVYSCSRAFVIPSLNISKILPETGTETIEFTPKKTGRLAYSCSMGMYTGAFNVVK